MVDRFEICHPITALWEGGWSDHKADPGGATMYGVTQAVYDAWRKKRGLPKQTVRSITRREALFIYKDNYWNACGAPDLFPGVDLAVYDASVNSGVSRGRKWLKAAVGSNDHSVTVKKICRARLSFMQSLKIWKSFGKGWGRRVADIEVKGVAMALEAMGQSKVQITMAARGEVASAEKSAAGDKAKAKITGTAAAGSAAAPTVDASKVTDGSIPIDLTTIDAASLWIFGAVALGCLVFTAFLIIRSRAAKEREAAYKGLVAA